MFCWFGYFIYLCIIINDEMNLTDYQNLLLDGLVGALWSHTKKTGEECLKMIGISWEEFVAVIDRKKSSYSQRCNAVDYFKAKLQSGATPMECKSIVFDSPDSVSLSTRTHLPIPILKQI